MFPANVPADSQELINEGDLLVAERISNDLAGIMDKSGNKLFDIDIACDYADIPPAKGNKGLRVVLTDPQLCYPVW